ncbi:MAG: glutamine synthetase type III, partial [Clostridia bacterium]|nr:glutamine synthetase type III [Clostridia bacterium]
RDYIPAAETYISRLAETATKKRALSPTLSCALEEDLIRRLSALSYEAYCAVEELKKEETAAAAIRDARERAERYCNVVIPVMDKLRRAVDRMEVLTAGQLWPVPTYGDLMFRV